MSDEIRMCIDRLIPGYMQRMAVATAVRENPANAANPLEIAGITQFFWRPGRTLRVRFLDGDPGVQAKVEATAHEWSRYANIRFLFGNDPDAEIRISFLQPGSWSYVGTYALNVTGDEPTMNFGWLNTETEAEEISRVVLHEFGHALGCVHEHQHPEHGIPWDVERVYAFYAQTQGWDKLTVDINVLQAYDKSISQYSEFDPQSIMLYPISNLLTVGDWEIPWMNYMLSELDRSFIGQVYPRQEALDAAVMAASGKLFFFRGDLYFRMTPGRGVDPGYPRTIAGHWRGMPAEFTSDIDAVMSLPDSKLYFLKGADVVRYTLGEGVDAGYPRPIQEEWPISDFSDVAVEADPIVPPEDLARKRQRGARPGTSSVRRHRVARQGASKRFDLVFEGGGAKGIAFTGALSAFLSSGHTYDRLMGTSAGAIMAAFVAAGYDGLEMRRALEERDEQGRPMMASFLGPPPPFPPDVVTDSLLQQWLRTVDVPLVPDFVEDFVDGWLMNALLKAPLYRHLFSFVEQGGWYGAQDLQAYLERKLNEGDFRGRRRNFGDMNLAEFYRATGTELSLLASDTTRGRLIVLNHRTAPDCPLVWAIRMSTSVPFLWQEVIWQAQWGQYRGVDIAGNMIVDGGILSSFPIELFITEQPMWLEIMGPKTGSRLIGMLIDEQVPVPGAPLAPGWDPEGVLNQFRPLQRVAGLVDTMMRARDKMVIEQYAPYVLRLPAKGYGTIEFNMSAARRAALAAAGRAAMESYLGQLPATAQVALSPMEMGQYTSRADDVAARILGSDEDISRNRPGGNHPA